MNLPTIVEKYLKKFSVSKWSIETYSNNYFENIVVIPAIDEFDNLQKLFVSLSKNNPKYFIDTLFLLVVNNLESTEEAVKIENKKTLEIFRKIINKIPENGFVDNMLMSGINIGLIDASSVVLPEKEGGVGFARKIGLDLGLTRLDYESSKKKILVCLDADCEVESNYLESIIELVNEKNIAAGYVEYEHPLPEDDEEKTAIIIYEIFLRYYVLGLKYSGSFFAFDTIGSTMICDYESYIKIGGMNKKKAAEDFYFMEKLAKITNVQKISSTKIYPSPRRSWRVPFGTGQRINRYFSYTHNEFLLLDPNCFVVLKQWLQIFMSEEILSAQEYIKIAETIHPELAKFLTEQSFHTSWEKILTDTDKKEQLQKQKQFWFDGFRTLKLIHHLRDIAFPMKDMVSSLEEMFALLNVNLSTQHKSGWQFYHEYLKLLRENNQLSINN